MASAVSSVSLYANKLVFHLAATGLRPQEILCWYQQKYPLFLAHLLYCFPSVDHLLMLTPPLSLQSCVGSPSVHVSRSRFLKTMPQVPTMLYSKITSPSHHQAIVPMLIAF